MNTVTVDHSLQSLLSGLTVSELREVQLLTTGGIESKGRKQELIDSLLGEVDRAKLEQVAQRVEALSPSKYQWLFSLGAPPLRSRSPGEMEEIAAALWPDSSDALGSLDPSSEELQPTLQVFDSRGRRLYVKLTHWVESHRWELVHATRKELRHYRLRHPISVVVDGNHGFVAVRFDGFTQGAATPVESRVSYEQLAGEVSGMIGGRLGTTIPGLPLASAMNDLLARRSDEVKDVRRSIVPADGGRLLIDTGGADLDSDKAVGVTAFLAGFIDFGEINISALETAIEESLRSMTTDSALLLWKSPRFLSRITFYETAPELYFLWQGGDKSLEAVEFVTTELLKQFRFVADPTLVRPTDYVAGLSAGSIVRASDLIHRFGVSKSEAWTVLEDARRAGSLEIRFRVRSDSALPDYRNSWVSSMADLPLIVTTSSGESIDTESAKNVEVAFLRTDRPK